ncbi:UDP-galactose transporter senju [Folsomia candida]|nr:UDP-galactose transporter senju [Folsomia candida]
MPQKRKISDLFPTSWSFFIFVLYMLLFINQGILVTASQNTNHQGYSYNTIIAVLLTEVIKLWVSAGIFIQRNSVAVFVGELRQNSKVLFLYFIPAGLYCLYNNLAFMNLVNFDPTTYFLLLQFRVVVTGIVFQMLFQKRLSKYQWISLIFLTIGCMIKELKLGWLLLDPDSLVVENLQKSVGNEKISEISGGATVASAADKVQKLGFLDNPMGVVLILLQVLCSSFAGVYNEFLLKRPTSASQKQLPILIQNVCLYIDSIICNLGLLVFRNNLSVLTDFSAMKTILTTPITLAVVLNNAAIGIVTSFFLAQLNSILKTFASALELMFTAILCWLIFDIPIHLNTAVAIFIVTLAIWLYSKEPVHNPATTSNHGHASKKEEDDMQKMLNEEMEV